ncbi:MAG: hypothetical protein H7A46_20900 [Verrucomicrobiales bacterium]|nr:hypothetical protein [Verrucomicrobiales bacterium]
MIKTRFLLALALTAVATAPVNRAAEPVAPPLEEVMSVIRTNLPDVSAAELNAAAVRGVVEGMGPRVSWIDSHPPAVTATNLVPVAELLDERFVLVRVGEVAQGLAKELRARVEALRKEAKPAGLVLDLRFAHGWDYAEAVHTAELFLKNAGPVLDWGGGMVDAAPSGAWSVGPVTVLVNSRTAGAAEALAAVLRDQEVALTLGGQTAGEAFAFQDHALSTGASLRIASGTVRLGDGTELPSAGLMPDVRVNVPIEQERTLVNDGEVARTTAAQGQVAANGPRRMTEADLVRLHREGMQALTNPPPAEATAPAAPPAVIDPVLARALDLLRGLVILRSVRE